MRAHSMIMYPTCDKWYSDQMIALEWIKQILKMVHVVQQKHGFVWMKLGGTLKGLFCIWSSIVNF